MSIRVVAYLLFSVALLSGSSTLAKPQGASPASVSELTILSHGKKMPGIAYLAAGQGPHPTVLLLHGYPGNEKNLDVAQALRRLGWNVIFFHYRGAWGSEGEFSFRGAEQDVKVVLQYLRNEEHASDLRVDPQRISIVGHSMGGHMAMAGIFGDSDVRCAVAYDGVNLGANGSGIFSNPEAAKIWKDYSDSLFMLNGWSGSKAEQEILEYGEQLDLVSRAGKINGRPVLIIPADTEVIPMELHINPLVAALRQTKNSKITVKLINDDHSFSASRLALIETTANFLNASCK